MAVSHHRPQKKLFALVQRKRETSIEGITPQGSPYRSPTVTFSYRGGRVKKKIENGVKAGGREQVKVRKQQHRRRRR